MTPQQSQHRRIVRVLGKCTRCAAGLPARLARPAGPLLVFAASLLALNPACAGASAFVVHEPTVLGPSGSVHHVNSGGFEAGYDWVLTQGIDNPEVNAGFWEAPLTEGAYQVEAFIPKEIGVTYARYLITHASHSSEVRLRQSNFADEWVVLGDWAFDSSQSSVRSTDSAGYPSEQLAWSAVRFTPLATLPPNMEVTGDTTTINEPQISGPEGFVVRFVGVGFRGDLLRVYARGASATAVNSATWSAPLAAGVYALEAYIPKEHAEAEVSYTVYALAGDSTIPVSQKSFNNLWVPLGNFHFGPAGASVTSTDATGVKEEEIAWDALRFKLVSLDKTEEKITTKPEEPVVKIVEPPGPTIEPLLSPPPEPLLDLPTFQIKSGPRHHRHLGPGDSYKLQAILATSPSLKLHYRCKPCLEIPPPVRLLPHSQTPLTRVIKGSGNLHHLLHRDFYKGTVLEVEVSAPNYRPLLYTYRLHGHGHPAEPTICAAAPAKTGRCAS